MKIKSINKTIIFIIIAVVISVLLRTTFKIAPGFEIVTAFSVSAGYLFTRKYLAFLIPIAIMAISDLIIGNTNIYLFTWSAFLIAPLIGILIDKMKIGKSLDFKIDLLKGTSSSIISVIIFFLWTNLGVVFLTTMYGKDFSGIILSYLNGLPFLKTQILSAIIFTPLIFAIVYLLNNLSSRKLFKMNFSR